MFKYLKNNEINNFKNHKRSYRKYWFKFMDFKIKDNIWWDCTFKAYVSDIRVQATLGPESPVEVYSAIA